MMDLAKTNARIVALEWDIAHITDAETVKMLSAELAELRKSLAAFLKSERARGKTYGSWSAKDIIPKPP